MKEQFGRIGKICTVDGGIVGVGGASARSNQALERILNPERFRLSRIRGIKETEDPTKNNDYLQIAVWMSYPDVQPHLRTTIPQITKPEDIPIAQREADRLFHNRNRVDEKTGLYIDDDPNKIIPIVAENGLGEPVASLIMRLKGDPFAKTSDGNKDAEKSQDGEKQVTDEEVATRGIENLVTAYGAHFGTKLMAAALDFMFNNKLYDGKSTGAVRLWIRSDSGAGNIGPKMDFFRSLGFEVIAGNWREYAKARGIPNPDNIDGQQYEITKAKWEEAKKEDAKRKLEDGGPRFVLPSGIIDLASLRIPHVPVENK
jgi:hypothetical protein